MRWTPSALEHAALVAVGLLIYVIATRWAHQQRHPSAAIAWVLALVAFPYLALPLFLLVGTRKLNRPQRTRPATTQVSTGPGTANGRWVARLARSMELDDAAPGAGIVFDEEGSAALRRLLNLLDGAARTLDACSFILADDAAGGAIADAMLLAASRGVRVRLLLDAVGSIRCRRSLLRRLEAGGVTVRRFMPLLHAPWSGQANLRNHRKLVVVDGEVLWSGGRNFSAEYFLGRHGQPAWQDLSFVVRGELAGVALRTFERDWNAAGGGSVQAAANAPKMPSALSPPETAAARCVQWWPSGPDQLDDTVYALLVEAAHQAQQRLLLATPYFVPDETLTLALKLACRRGVDVRLLVPVRSNHRIADIARGRALRSLAAAGGRIHLYPTMLHAKALVVDDALALCGSVNLDGRSLFLNYEAMTAFREAAQIDWLAGWFERRVAQSDSFGTHTPSLPRDLLEGVVRAVGFQL